MDISVLIGAPILDENGQEVGVVDGILILGDTLHLISDIEVDGEPDDGDKEEIPEEPVKLLKAVAGGKA